MGFQLKLAESRMLEPINMYDYVCRVYLSSICILVPLHSSVASKAKALFDWILFFSNRHTLNMTSVDHEPCEFGITWPHTSDHLPQSISDYRPRSQLSCLLFRSLFGFSYCLLWLAFWRHSLEPSWTIWRTVQTGCEWIEKLRYKWRPTS